MITSIAIWFAAGFLALCALIPGRETARQVIADEAPREHLITGMIMLTIAALLVRAA